MDRTLEPTAQYSDEEDFHSACQSQPGHALVGGGGTDGSGLIIPRGAPVPIESLARSRTRDIDQDSTLTVSCLIDYLINDPSGSEDGSNDDDDGACPRPFLGPILRRQSPVTQRSSLLRPEWSATMISNRPALEYTTMSDQNNEAGIDVMIRRYEESILHMLRQFNRMLENSRSLLISQAPNNRVNFRLVSEVLIMFIPVLFP